MNIRVLSALAALLLLLAACGDGADEGGASPDDATGDAQGAEEPAGPDADLDDETAAEVNGVAIPRERVDERVDEAIAGDEELAAQVEGSGGEDLLGMFRAQTLTILIQTRIILDSAAELDVEPDDADVDAAREDLVAELGGEEAFADAVAQAGISEDALRDQLEGVAALEAVGERLVEEGETPEAPEGAEDADPAELAAQQWLAEQVANAEVAVHPDLGQWDPQSGQVMPAAGPPAAPGAPAEDELPDDE